MSRVVAAVFNTAVLVGLLLKRSPQSRCAGQEWVLARMSSTSSTIRWAL